MTLRVLRHRLAARVGLSVVTALVLEIAAGGRVEAGPPVRLEVEPAEIVLDGARATAQVLVTGQAADGTCIDLTHAAEWSCDDPGIATTAPGGRLAPASEGITSVVARVGGLEARARVVVRNAGARSPVSFRHEVQPALTRAGCNQGACHGTPSGKNGFRLSLRGYDPVLDYRSLAREVGARRSNPFEPQASLILQKGTGAVPHEGGTRLTIGDPSHRLLSTWVAEGLRPDPPETAPLVGLDVLPADRVLDDPAQEQQLAVIARFSDGSARDVTELANFKSTDESVAAVGADGRVVRAARGEATMLVNYGHLYATSRLVFRVPVAGLSWVDPPEANFVDTHVFAKLKLLQIPPSELSDDATFCRRVYLDVLGLPPTPEEVVAFLEDDHPDRRARLIDALLERPEYADFWALKWADTLGDNQRYTGHKGAYSYHRWIRDQVAADTPLDQFARAIVTAKGSNYTSPPASFYRRVRSPEDAVEAVSQLFLGVRLQCARCHNHVAERWTQDDYYGMAAFFSQVRYKNGPQTFAQYNKEEAVYLRAGAEVVQPRTGATMAPKPLGAEAVALDKSDDRRAALADWLTRPENPFFARAAVNRLWYHLMGRGIVDPVDDIRESNPPASRALLDALAADFVAHGFDVKHTLRTILTSRTYQLSSRPNAFNVEDERYFSHARIRLLTAEQLLDAVSQATGVPERFVHLPPGTRAAQIPDGEFAHPFLRSFGQPLRSDACECARASDTTLEQALQVIGGRTIHEKLVARKNRLGSLIERGVDDAALTEDLFLATLGRHPDAEERRLAIAALAARADDRRTAAEDLLWSLLNHPEFLFQH